MPYAPKWEQQEIERGWSIWNILLVRIHFVGISARNYFGLKHRHCMIFSQRATELFCGLFNNAFSIEAIKDDR
jgi:hypothetical protein